MSYRVQFDGRELDVTVRDSLETLHGLRAAWTELLSQSTHHSGFSTWEWLYTWSERFIRGGRRLS